MGRWDDREEDLGGVVWVEEDGVESDAGLSIGPERVACVGVGIVAG